MKLPTDLHQITDISGPPDFSRNTIQLTLFDLYIRTLYTSKRNQIENPHGSQLNHRHFRQLSDFSRKTIQFNTSIYISKHFTPLNVIKYILKHLLHAFQLLIYNTLRYRWNSSRIYIKSQTFQDHQTSRGTQFNWHFSIYISEHFTPLNAIKYKLHMDLS